jgi:hypothetical protein
MSDTTRAEAGGGVGADWEEGAVEAVEEEGLEEEGLEEEGLEEEVREGSVL